MKLVKIIITFLFIIGLSSAQELNWSFLDNKSIGSYDFIGKHPESDGRAVVIFILDNGVDPLIPGLTTTSTGETKVIDMQDFSGQLELTLKLAEYAKFQNTEVLKSGDITLEGYGAIKAKPSDGKYYLARIDESKHYKNSPVSDLNNNGSNNDKFAILAFKISNGMELFRNSKGKVKPDNEMWVYLIDEDGDGSVDDEEIKCDYKYNYDTFDFYKGEPSAKPLVTMSAKISSSKIIIHTCDGSHGTHCAGIASGNDIYDTKGYDGIAPGAYVVSLKIGHNALSGGATTTESMKKAYEYGIEFMKQAGFEYGVYSMSYGIGSETPGYSEIEKFLDEFAIKHPNIAIVTSNGNNGPGINSTGNPAGANNIISAGAMISPATLKDLYGSARTKNWITHFSSRGGESPKPDVIAPGSASSTVPNFENSDRFWGTSMACPQVAGACAVLFSHAVNQGVPVDGGMIKRAIKFSAQPISGYGYESQGRGLVNIENAWQLLKIMADRGDKGKIFNYSIVAPNTFYPSGEGPNAFWKAGGYFPKSNYKQTATIKAVFTEDTPKEDRQNFYRIFSLKSSADWLDLDKSKIYLRGELTGEIGFFINDSKLTKPGIYVARIDAIPDNVKSGDKADYDVQVGIVIPEKLNENMELRKSNQSLDIGDLSREFLQIPPGATSMGIELKPIPGKHFGLAAYLFSPDGNNTAFSNKYESKDNTSIKFNIDDDELMRGTWELLPYSYYQSREKSNYEINVKFYGISSTPKVTNKIENEIGLAPNFSVKFFNDFASPVFADINGSLMGYKSCSSVSKTNLDKFTKPIRIGKDISKVVIDVSMAIEEFNKHTDLAVNIYNSSGEAVMSGGISRMREKLSFMPPQAGEYQLEIVPGFVSEEIKAKDWKFKIEENYYYSTPIEITTKRKSIYLLPGVAAECKFELSNSLPQAPTESKTFGEITIRDKATGNKVHTHKILLD